MSNDKKSIFEKIPFLLKLKKIKGIEYIAIGVLCLFVFVIYFSSITKNDSKSLSTSGQNISYSAYANELEQKLSKVLSKIQGAGKVDVMITISSSSEIVVATSTEEKSNISSGSSNTTQSTTKKEEPIIIKDTPLIVMEKLPEIQGVIVVAQGAQNVKVRLDLLKAVQTLISIDVNKIEILVGE